MDDYKKNLNVAEINSIQKRCVYEVNEVIDNTPSCPSCHKPFGNKMDLAAHQSASKHFGGLNWTAHCCGTFFRSYEDCFAHFRLEHQCFEGNLENTCNSPVCREKGRNFPQKE